MLYLPLLAGLLYALGAIFLKQVVDGGLGPWRMTVINGWALAVMFTPLLLMPSAPVSEIPWHHIIISAALSFVGNLFLMLSLSRGDVSVATPITGSKVVFVALVAVVVFGETIPVKWWIAAFLSAGAIGLLRVEAGGARRNLRATVFYALTSSIVFAVADVLIQKWATPQVYNRYMPLTFIGGAVMSLLLWPQFSQPIWAIPGAVRKPLFGCCLLMGAQAWLIFYTLSHYGHATAVNVVYGARGLWAVTLIWTMGRWLGNAEGQAGHKAMARRMVGAAILLIAVLLVTI